jgi:hypothetical protein
MVPGGLGTRALGLVAASDASAAHASNAAWVEDCTIHLVCVLALDRFGDFLSDQVGEGKGCNNDLSVWVHVGYHLVTVAPKLVSWLRLCLTAAAAQACRAE